MNDSTEQLLASELAVSVISSLHYPKRSFGEGMAEYALELLERGGKFHWEASRTYTVSLTSELDSLEQWRAYCPRSGGVALGFSAKHLAAVAADQGYLLAPCVYDQPTQRAIVEQIVIHHLRIWDDRLPLVATREGISSHLVHDFVADLERYAALLKHSSFSAEREWRLISPLAGEGPAPSYIHLPTTSGIKQFRSFSLLTIDHPEIADDLNGDTIWQIGSERQGFRPVIGPCLDPDGMDEAIRTLTPPEFGHIFRCERTASPFR